MFVYELSGCGFESSCSHFTYSASGPFTKNKEGIIKFKETGDSRYIYQNELGKACFQLNMAYGNFKYLNKRTAADKVLCDKAFNIAKNPKCGRYQCRLAWIEYNFFDQKLQVVLLKKNLCKMKN